MSDVIKAEVERKLAALPEVREVHVEIVFDPPWNPAMMSEAAKLQLGFDSDYGSPAGNTAPAAPAPSAFFADLDRSRQPISAGQPPRFSVSFSFDCFSPSCSNWLRQSSDSTNARDSRQPGSTMMCSSRYTCVPSSDSILRRAPVPIAFSFAPPLPIRIAFCPSRSQ